METTHTHKWETEIILLPRPSLILRRTRHLVIWHCGRPCVRMKEQVNEKCCCGETRNRNDKYVHCNIAMCKVCGGKWPLNHPMRPPFLGE